MEDQNNKLRIAVFTTDSQFYTSIPIFNNSSNNNYINTYQDYFTFQSDIDKTDYLAYIYPMNDLKNNE